MSFPVRSEEVWKEVFIFDTLISEQLKELCCILETFSDVCVIYH